MKNANELNRAYVIDWIYGLETQTLTDELKEDIIEAFEMYAKRQENGPTGSID